MENERGNALSESLQNLPMGLIIWIATVKFAVETGLLSRSTVPVGTTLIRPEDSEQSLVVRADHLMYENKRTGKDQIICNC